MTKITLAPYAFTIRRTRSNSPVRLDNFDGTQSALPFFSRFVYRVQEIGGQHDQQRRRMMRADAVHEGLETVRGRLYNGEYGFETELYDVETAEVRPKKSTEADLAPYYYQVCCPAGAHRGVAVFQRIGVRSIANDFQNGFAAYFRTANPGYSIRFERLIPRELISEYLSNGELREIVLSRHRVPRHVEDLYNDDGLTEEIGLFQEVMRPRRGIGFGIPRWIQRLIDGEEFANVVGIVDPDIDGVALDLKIGNETRKIHLDNLSKFNGNIDITDDIDFDLGGNPTYDSVDTKSNELIRDLREQLGL